MSPAEHQTGGDTPAGRLILGTAGHIDHGKTALCRALTGVDTDRLPEEKERGITIELGFAPLDLPDGTRLGVVDVPGHERLVRTMVAGAAGIDLLLLVVAADEGVMPQTREHFAICRLLGIDRAVVALTKVDLVDDEMRALAAEDVGELLAGSALAGSVVVPVSSTSGEGIEMLREALATLAAGTRPRTPRKGPARLPIDRVFEMRGFGPVVTGTLLGDALEVGQNVTVLPDGARARIRGLQSHGEKAQRVSPGARCAVNLQGVALDALARGQMLSAPDALTPTRTLDVEIDWLAEAPPLERPTSVSLLLGTCERMARLAPIGAARLLPGTRAFARLHVDGDAIAALPGDRFVLRGFARSAVGATLGGGSVLDAHPPRRRRSDPDLLRDLEVLRDVTPIDALAVRVRRAGLSGFTRDALARETGLPAAELEAAVQALVREGRAIREASHVFDAEALDRLGAELCATLDAYHAAEPLRPGMPAGTLRGSLPDNVPAPVVERVLSTLAEQREIALEGEWVRRATHQPTLDADAEASCEKILARLATAGLEAPSLRDLSGDLGIAEAPLRDLLAHLTRQRRLAKAPADLWFDAAALDSLRERVRAHFAENEVLDTPTFKALIGTTRRTAVPLMELLDEEKLTLRRGEQRRRGPAA